ncbi:TRAP transporter large permease subunit [Dehalobacter sp. DCM]|uniref:TRAP transporter large permease n=1 Tax=Dehalobacter sp. DCM TaxID=2907827 RepID=UPI0030819FAC|nr:TRAP transporter large permease subunit [Dehalobacter sp. DCM]
MDDAITQKLHVDILPPGKLRGLDKMIAVLDKVGTVCRYVNIIGVGMLFLMLVLTFINVIMRKFFNSPIVGVVEITEVLMVMAVFLAIGHTQNKKGHVSVDLITEKLKPVPKLIMEGMHNLLATFIFIIIIWQVILQTIYFAANNSNHSQYLFLPNAPFDAIIAFGCILLTLLLIRDFLINIRDGLNCKLKGFQWLLMIGIPVLIAVFSYFWMQPTLWHIDKVTVGIIGIVLSVVLFLVGFPIAYTMFFVSFIFVGNVRGIPTALDMLASDTFRTVSSYSWSVLPFFTLMGFVCLYARFGDDLFVAAFKWIGHKAGGMAMATVAACAAFGAIVGDSVSATATMSSVAAEPMKRYKYKDVLTAGAIVGGASLGPVIPPSVIFIMFGLLTGVSIGDLFMGGVFPGLLMALCFIAIISIWCKMDPTLAPPGERSNWKERIISLKAVGPVVILFVIVIGGIYTGVFTPTEGGAIGAFIALILGLLGRRVNFKIFANTLLESGNVIAMTFLIVISSNMFTRMLAWSNVSGAMKRFVLDLNMTPSIFVIVTMLIFTFLGCFLNGISLILITIPIFFPITTALNIDPMWFLILSCIAMNLGNLTPPVGINLFVLKGMQKDMLMSDIYKGSVPFVIGTLVTLILLFLFPPISTWLPSILR